MLHVSLPVQGPLQRRPFRHELSRKLPRVGDITGTYTGIGFVFTWRGGRSFASGSLDARRSRGASVRARGRDRLKKHGK